MPFEAHFASELPDFHVVSSMPGVDGFTLKVDALYKVSMVRRIEAQDQGHFKGYRKEDDIISLMSVSFYSILTGRSFFIVVKLIIHLTVYPTDQQNSLICIYSLIMALCCPS